MAFARNHGTAAARVSPTHAAASLSLSEPDCGALARKQVEDGKGDAAMRAGGMGAWPKHTTTRCCGTGDNKGWLWEPPSPQEMFAFLPGGASTLGATIGGANMLRGCWSVYTVMDLVAGGFGGLWPTYGAATHNQTLSPQVVGRHHPTHPHSPSAVD